MSPAPPATGQITDSTGDTGRPPPSPAEVEPRRSGRSWSAALPWVAAGLVLGLFLAAGWWSGAVRTVVAAIERRSVDLLYLALAGVTALAFTGRAVAVRWGRAGGRWI